MERGAWGILKYRANLQYPTKKDGSKQSNTFLFK